MRSKVGLAMVFLMSSLIGNQAFGVGTGAYGNSVPTARGISRASAVIATIDDASAVTFNPARLSAMEGGDVSLGVTLIDLGAEYSGTGSATGSTSETEMGTQFQPNFHFGSPFGTEKWGFGLGINTPWALVSDWPDNGPLRYIATEAELVTWDINPGVAYQVNDSFSVGAGLNYYNISTLEINSRVNVTVLNTVLGTPSAAPDGFRKLEGDGSDLGFNVGLAGNRDQRHFFGATYHSGANIEVDGDLSLSGLSGASAFVFGGSNYKTDIDSKVLIPRKVSLGYGYKPSEKWVFELDADWYEWSKFKEQTINFAETSTTRLAVLNADNPLPRNWENVWSVGLGTEYNLNDRWALRGGYGFIEGPVPNSTFEAAIPDSDFHMVALGVGYDTGSLYFDFSPQLYLVNDRHIDNNVGATSASTGDGDYEVDVVFYTFNVGYKWGRN